jgi:hypothetical protein
MDDVTRQIETCAPKKATKLKSIKKVVTDDNDHCFHSLPTRVTMGPAESHRSMLTISQTRTNSYLLLCTQGRRGIT